MSDPHDNDSWADLYNDLGIDVPPSPPKPAPEDPEPVEEPQLVEAPEDAEGEPDEEFAVALDDCDDGDADGEADELTPEGTPGEGEPGQKKRRRRRRRRKKKGGGSEAAAPEGDAEPMTDAEPEPVEAVEDEEAFDDDSVEGASPEATREIISNWNVPSWQEIVAGLYRPDR